MTVTVAVAFHSPFRVLAVITVVPGALAVIRPLSSIKAVLVLLLLHKAFLFVASSGSTVTPSFAESPGSRESSLRSS
ncbi:hypothetical protein D3C75_614220 [compost metagenome]